MSGTIYCIMLPFYDKTYYWDGRGPDVVNCAEQKRHARTWKTLAGAEKALVRCQKMYPKAFISEI